MYLPPSLEPSPRLLRISPQSRPPYFPSVRPWECRGYHRTPSQSPVGNGLAHSAYQEPHKCRWIAERASPLPTSAGASGAALHFPSVRPWECRGYHRIPSQPSVGNGLAHSAYPKPRKCRWFAERASPLPTLAGATESPFIREGHGKSAARVGGACHVPNYSVMPISSWASLESASRMTVFSSPVREAFSASRARVNS